jgi:hypothetical protein
MSNIFLAKPLHCEKCYSRHQQWPPICVSSIQGWRQPFVFIIAEAIKPLCQIFIIKPTAYIIALR